MTNATVTETAEAKTIKQRAERFKATLILCVVYAIISGGLYVALVRYGSDPRSEFGQMRVGILTVLVGIVVVTAWAILRVVFPGKTDQDVRETERRRRGVNARSSSCPDGYSYTEDEKGNRKCKMLNADGSEETITLSDGEISGYSNDIEDGTATARCAYATAKNLTWSDIGC